MKLSPEKKKNIVPTAFPVTAYRKENRHEFEYIYITESSLLYITYFKYSIIMSHERYPKTIDLFCHIQAVH